VTVASETTAREARTLRLSAFFNRHSPEILDEWQRAVATVQSARTTSAADLTDQMPELLAQVARRARDIVGEDPRNTGLTSAQDHAVERLGAGFDIVFVVSELSLLRECVLRIWHREMATRSDEELRAIDLAIDHAIGASVARYAQAHERTLAAIDAISTATLEAGSLEELLRRLLGELMRLTPNVDTAAILLADEGRLYLRAAVGLEQEVAAGTSIAIGEGFWGTIAAMRKPLAVGEAYSDPFVKSHLFHERSIRGLYGVPLLHDDALIGVAHMGSRNAADFSAEQRHLFGTMAARAAAGIRHHLLRQQMLSLEERARRVAAERERVLGKLESLLAAAPVPIAFLDRDLQFLRVNEALARLDGKSVHDYLGTHVSDALPDAAPLLVPILQRILDTGEPVLNWEVQGALPSSPDEIRTFVANCFPVRREGESISGLGAIVLEVTERDRAEERLREALRVRDEVLAIVSHDLRNPLANIRLGAAQIEDVAPLDARARTCVTVIERSVERMEHLIEDLLDTAAIRAGKLTVQLRPVDVEALVSDARELQMPSAAEKGISIEVRLSTGHVALLCDRNRVLQLFGNLIGNALRYCAAGDTITITGERNVDAMVFCVADTGPGIEPELAPLVFEPYRGSRQERRTSGLGLYICKGIAEAHGGRIWLETQLGHGTRFFFALPGVR
jgi:PAS domain S-box-containing protein